MFNNFKNNFLENGYAVLSLLPESIKSIEDFLADNINFLNTSNTCEFRAKLLEMQTEINRDGFIKKFITLHLDPLISLLGSDKISHTGVAYLRGVRPSKENTEDDYLDFHRERFYADGDYIKHQINVHIPLKHYNSLCSMKYVPKSHLIPDHEIVTMRLDEGAKGIERASNGHLLGLSYAPKKIISGVDLSCAVGVPVHHGEFMLFSTDLIHGSGANLTDDIRFSIDFGVISDDNLTGAKKYSTASYLTSKKPYISYYET